MRVYIGPYLNWWGPYQLADLLQHVGVSEDRCYKIGGWLADTWVGPLCQWIYNRRKRDVRVKIHNYDIWSLRTTLAAVILPALEMIAADKYGTPMLDYELGMPDELMPVPGEDDINGEVGALMWEKRWAYVLNEMIWAFRAELDEDVELEIYEACGDWRVVQQHDLRIANGMKLFGAHYRALWT